MVIRGGIIIQEEKSSVYIYNIYTLKAAIIARVPGIIGEKLEIKEGSKAAYGANCRDGKSIAVIVDKRTLFLDKNEFSKVAIFHKEW